MRLEKREITLNEYDSLKDVFYLQKILLAEYGNGIAKAKRKEVRNELTSLMKEIVEDMFLLQDLLSLSGNENKVGQEQENE